MLTRCRVGPSADSAIIACRATQPHIKAAPRRVVDIPNQPEAAFPAAVRETTDRLGILRQAVRDWSQGRPGYMARARFVISPAIPRLARPPIFAWICRMLRSVDVASASISLTMR